MLAGCDDDSVMVAPDPASSVAVTSQEAAVDNPIIPSQPLQNVPWSWQYTVSKDGNKTAPDHPENYVLLLRPDGGIAVRADCNRGGSAFKEREGGKIELEAIAMTKMLCPPESRSNEFIADLHGIESYRMNGNMLMLTLRNQSTMFFTPLVTP